MQKYKIEKRLGEGTFAEVVLAKRNATGEYVAIKVLKQPAKSIHNLEQALRLREVQASHLLGIHPHILGIEEILL